MSNLPLQRCLEPGCRALVPRGRCIAHTKEHSREHNNKDFQSLYKDKRWAAASRQFRREHPLCASCLSRNVVTASEVTDHIKSVANGGEFWDESNWQALCKSCHNSKTALEQAERRKAL